MPNEMKELFDNYMREHLSISVTTGADYYTSNKVRVELLLDGETISHDEARLPDEN